MTTPYKRIIAVDFDGCLVEDKWPEIGEPIDTTIAQVKAAQTNGASIILWTCRTGALLEAAVQWCHTHGIILEAVNENLPLVQQMFDTPSGPKVYADEYWDDKAVHKPSKCGGKCHELLEV